MDCVLAKAAGRKMTDLPFVGQVLWSTAEHSPCGRAVGYTLNTLGRKEMRAGSVVADPSERQVILSFACGRSCQSMEESELLGRCEQKIAWLNLK